MRRSSVGLGLCLLLCLGGLVPFARQGWRDWKVFREYAETRCTVVALGSYETAGKNRAKNRHPELTYRLQAGGTNYFATGFDNMDGRLASLSDAGGFRIGESYPCWYDPDDPERAVLVRRIHRPFYAAAAIPGFMLFITASMMARLRRKERRLWRKGGIPP